jgi:hypothetical protein
MHTETSGAHVQVWRASTDSIVAQLDKETTMGNGKTSKAMKKIQSIATAIGKMSDDCDNLRYEAGMSEADVDALKMTIGHLIDVKHKVLRCMLPITTATEDRRAHHKEMMSG